MWFHYDINICFICLTVYQNIHNFNTKCIQVFSNDRHFHSKTKYNCWITWFFTNEQQMKLYHNTKCCWGTTNPIANDCVSPLQQLAFKSPPIKDVQQYACGYSGHLTKDFSLAHELENINNLEQVTIYRVFHDFRT